MATQPVLQGTTLPVPQNPGGYDVRYGIRSVSIETANGNLVFQNVTSAAKREFTLNWRAITESQFSIIRTAYDALVTSPISNNFTSPDGGTYTVTPTPNNPPLEASYIETPSGARWDVSMRLREVSTS